MSMISDLHARHFSPESHAWNEPEMIDLTVSNVGDAIKALIDHEEAFSSDWGISNLIAALALLGTVGPRIDAVSDYVAKARSLLRQCGDDEGLSSELREACQALSVARSATPQVEPSPTTDSREDTCANVAHVSPIASTAIKPSSLTTPWHASPSALDRSYRIGREGLASSLNKGPTGLARAWMDPDA